MNRSAVSRLAVVEFLTCVFAIPLDSTHVRWLSEAVVAPLFTAVLGDERWNTGKRRPIVRVLWPVRRALRQCLPMRNNTTSNDLEFFISPAPARYQVAPDTP